MSSVPSVSVTATADGRTDAAALASVEGAGPLASGAADEAALDGLAVGAGAAARGDERAQTGEAGAGEESVAG